jgi:hypothetical protein
VSLFKPKKAPSPKDGLSFTPHWLQVGPVNEQVEILVRHLVGPGAPHRAVLLIPGANSSCDTFTIPGNGLVGHLAALGCDVWMLDWRASPKVWDQLTATGTVGPGKFLGGTSETERRAFTLDRAVHEDIPAALAYMSNAIGGLPISIHAHCVGGGGTAMAIARGLVDPYNVTHVVLSTLGLFYEVPWNTWIKAEDFLLERMLAISDRPNCRTIDPRDPARWPEAFKNAFDHWPGSWLPSRTTPADDFLRHLSFMVGVPYSRDRLDPSINGKPVEDCFGPLHAGLYLQLGQMVRRGYSARYNERDQIDRFRLFNGYKARPAPRGDLNPVHFSKYDITLIAATDNGVWHRDSIDLMYEWLRRDPKVRCEKYIAQGYNIQELYWARSARETLYDVFAAGLGAKPAQSIRRFSA